MQLALLLISIVAAAAAIVAAGAAVSQARTAKRERLDSQTARDDAQLARDQSRAASADAEQRASEVSEALSRIAAASEAALPAAKPFFRFQRVSGNRWAATNVGDAVAYSAQVLPASPEFEGWLRPEELDPRDVGPGDSLFFLALSSAQTADPRLTIRFERHDGSDVEVLEFSMTVV